jgi:alkanesulfonate monooxygenase SsuD/methylene tetrahydromethanopterin reductase-like flavin-dependent oxidoreductase (luciferase family)
MTGLPFQPTAERYELLEDLLRLAAHMWDGNTSPFEGRHHRAESPISRPAPIARPRVLVGGMGERRTLPLVARYADACNLFDIPDGGATLRRKLDVLAQACDAIGRDPASIEVTLSSRVAPGETLGAFVDRCHGLARLGVDHVVVLTAGPWQLEGDLDIVLDAVEPLGSVDRPVAARGGAR